MTLFPLATMGLFAAAYTVGGSLRRIRVIACPLILGIGVGWVCRDFIAGVLVAGAYNVIRCGYGAWDPQNDPKPSLLALLTHDRGGWWIRAIWGLLVALVGAFCLVAGKHLALPLYIAYAAGCAIVGFAGARLRFPVYLMDACVALSIASIILLVK